MVRQHLGHSAGEVRGFSAWESSKNLLHIRRTRLCYRFHPKIEPDIVSFHRLVSSPLRILDERMPLIDERSVGRSLDAFEIIPSSQMAD